MCGHTMCVGWLSAPASFDFILKIAMRTWCVRGCSVTHSCLTLRDPMDCSPPGSVHGISQARILEWVPFPTLGNLPDLGIKSHLLCLLHRRWILYHCTPWCSPPENVDMFQNYPESLVSSCENGDSTHRVLR